jgi:predicted butyrate kinase (DUF1464 family)
MRQAQYDIWIACSMLKDAFIERFADSYQVYLFPYSQPDYEGFEAASGAAAIAEGLYGQNARAEIVERLQIREANDSLKDEADIVAVRATMPGTYSDECFTSAINI